ncbi:phage repressor protein CI [Yersinia sp. 2540 StPb PI]|uniref:phage repressor protein CI n=1 Tax=Yersinia sp. 2540 StPb PI TaxID=3117406 RepID=UPI003FA44DEA
MKLNELEGGKAVLDRMLKAYGFSMQKELGDLHGLSSGTISTWIRRNYFPGEVVVACALDTGVSLRWLATGNGVMRDDHVNKDSVQYSKLKKLRIKQGIVVEDGEWVADKSLIDKSLVEPVYLEKNTKSWIVDLGADVIGNGRWLLDIDGDSDVYDVARIPGNRLKVTGATTSFDCKVEDVKTIGMIYLTLDKNA